MSSPSSSSLSPSKRLQSVHVETIHSPMGRMSGGTAALADDLSISMSTVSIKTSSRAQGDSDAPGASAQAPRRGEMNHLSPAQHRHPDDVSLATHNIHGGPFGGNDSGGGSDNHSLLGVIVDRSSFDEDDELTTFGGGKGDLASSMIDEDSSVITGLPAIVRPYNNPTPGGGGGVVMRNGKVRRRLRWKPRFSRNKSDGRDDNISSNASVVSALTSRTTSTNRSTSTSRSIFSHFSKRSMNSFHTFHSTETPVVTNKANRPQAPHTVMRPNYQDSFDAKKENTSNMSSSKHSTIHNEGQQKSSFNRSRAGSGDWKRKSDTTSGSSNDSSLERSSTLPYRLKDFASTPMSPIAESSPRPISQRSSFNGSGSTSPPTGVGGDKIRITNAHLAETGETEYLRSTPPKTRRPPLFKRRLRHINKKINIASSGSSDSLNDSSGNSRTRPTSPAESSQNSFSFVHDGAFLRHGARTARIASLTASILIERENSILPTLSAEEYEEDRRVSIQDSPPQSPSPASNSSIVAEEEKKEDEGEEVIALNASRIDEMRLEENSRTRIVGSKPMTSAGRQRTGSSLLQQGTSSQSSSGRGAVTTHGRTLSRPGGSPGFGSRVRRYNRPVDTMTPQSGGSCAEVSKARRSLPADVDDGAFLEAEHNLRAIHEMAQEHLTHGEYEEAVEVFEEILRGQQERYGQDHYRVGAALHNLGIVYLKKGDYEKAIEICSRAVQVRKESLVPNHPDVAVSLAQLGVAHLESRNYHKALNAFQDALNIRRNFLGPRHPKCSKILNNIGCALYSMEDYERSKMAFDEALDIQREALRNLPSAEGTESNGVQSNALLLSTASTLCNIGSIKLRMGEYEHALIALDEALLIQQSVLGDRHPTVKSTLDSIAFVETQREGPLQVATINLIKGASAVCNAGSSTNVAAMLGFETFESSSPMQWFKNSCGFQQEMDNDDNDIKNMKYKRRRGSTRIKRSEQQIKLYNGNSLADKDDGDEVGEGFGADGDGDDEKQTETSRDSLGASVPSSSSASASSHSTPTSSPLDLSPTSAIHPPSTMSFQRRRIDEFDAA